MRAPQGHPALTYSILAPRPGTRALAAVGQDLGGWILKQVISMPAEQQEKGKQ